MPPTRKGIQNRKSFTVHVAVTPELHANALRIAGSQEKIPEVMRQALRFYIDNHADINGSRRHFTKTFQDRIDGLEKHLSTQISTIEERYAELSNRMIIMMLATAFTVSLAMRTFLNAPQKENVFQHFQEGLAIARNEKTRSLFLNALDAIIDEYQAAG